MQDIARRIVAPGKGILAADESTGTIAKRFASIEVESTPESRRDYRELLFTADGIGDYIGGVILFDETLRQAATDGTPFPKVLEANGVVPGIKVDSGAKDLAGFPGEKVTEGLDGLRERISEYHGLGARFAKWRAVIDIGEGIPTPNCIKANAHALGRYAALCQEGGLVPIVEPEVLMDGAHDLERCYEVTSSVLRATFAELADARVDLSATLLKPNMVIPGKGSADQVGPSEIAEATVKCFTETVPAEIPGIVFLSGGQSEAEATANLNAMNAMGSHPWELSFSYGRALQQSALAAWKGDPANVAAGQAAFMHRAHLNGLARSGEYTPDMEQVA
ncbi:MAG: fructose-bisphosphate aldolase class I [Acidimicrobiia bacterium]|nr:fructose-bisphosphate aldolase class I [Acidimicrobiia bacterium]